MNQAPVAGHPGLVKDLHSGVVSNVDTDAFQAYITNRDKKLETENRLDALEGKMDLILQLLQGKK